MKKLLICVCAVLLTLFPVMSFAANQDLALSAGLGIVYPMGDMGDVIDYALSLPVAVQFAVIPNVSVEIDGYYYLYTSTDLDSFTLYQYGIGGRYWLEKAFNGIYCGAGLGRTHLETELKTTIPFFGTYTVKTDDDFTTLYLKAGYAIKLDPIILDMGIRYDAIDMDEWFDQPITLYAMATYPLSLK
jgi:hypothetical protein